MTDAPLACPSHYDALIDALPTDPAAVTDEHIGLVLAAFIGDEPRLWQQRADILLVERLMGRDKPHVLREVIDVCAEKRGNLAVGRARLRAWAWRVAYDRYPELHEGLTRSPLAAKQPSG